MVNLDWPNAMAGEADSVSSVLASACHTGDTIGVINPGELALVYGNLSLVQYQKKMENENIFLCFLSIRLTRGKVGLDGRRGVVRQVWLLTPFYYSY